MLKRLWVKALFMFVLFAALVFLPGAACGSPTTAPNVTPAAGSSTTKAGSTASATSAPSTTTYKVGDRVEVSGVALTVVSVVTSTEISSFKPSAGNIFLVCEVLVENVSQDSAPYNPMYFTVKDNSGAEYNTSMASPDPSLKSGDLGKGEKARGYISFEVPETAKGLVLTLSPMVLSGGYKIRVDLGK